MAAVRPVAAALAVVAALVAGIWFWSGVVAPGYWTSIGFGTAWFVLVSMVAGKLTKGRGSLRVATRVAMVSCSVLAVGGFYWTSIRETTVDEDIVVGVAASDLAVESGGLSADEQAAADEIAAEEAALAAETGEAPAAEPEPEPTADPRPVEELRAPVETRGHDARGRASVVRLPDGSRTLTLSDGFRIDPGPKVEVYLVTGDGTDVGDRGDRVELGELKGSKGDQQYRIPEGTDLAKHRTVVFWCVPFTTTLAVAALRPA